MVIRKLREERKIELNVKDDVAGFLGVNIRTVRDSEGREFLELTQTELIDCIISAMHLDGANPCKTPAEFKTLPKDANRELAEELFNYASVVGMLGYLVRHLRLELSFPMSQCAHYTFQPRRSHEKALKRIGRYLIRTRKQGLVLNSLYTDSLKMDCFVDANFAGLWSYEDPKDPTLVKSWTGFMICVCNCPIFWKSTLLGEIALSTMEAEYVALLTAMKELLLTLNLVKEVSVSVRLGAEVATNLHCDMWEDNAGALTLTNLEPPRMTPRSKHYAVKYHWFCLKLKSNKIRIRRIKSDLQRADLLTKLLRAWKFVENQRLSMSWYAANHSRSRGSVRKGF